MATEHRNYRLWIALGQLTEAEAKFGKRTAPIAPRKRLFRTSVTFQTDYRVSPYCFACATVLVTTVTYCSVALRVLAVVAIFFFAVRFAFPQFTESTLKKADDVARRVLEKAGMAPTTCTGVLTAEQAHFTALDGTVRVKKGTGNTWITADCLIPLEKGDVVQTGSEGMAKVVFNDGTSIPPSRIR